MYLYPQPKKYASLTSLIKDGKYIFLEMRDLKVKVYIHFKTKNLIRHYLI